MGRGAGAFGLPLNDVFLRPNIRYRTSTWRCPNEALARTSIMGEPWIRVRDFTARP